LYFPEIEHFIRSDHSDWLIQLLLRFPTPGAITSLSPEDFVVQAWSLIGRKVHKAALLAEIYAAAQRSIALPVMPDSVAVAMLRLVLEEYLALGRIARECCATGRNRLGEQSRPPQVDDGAGCWSLSPH
jgi:hypothetical protein